MDPAEISPEMLAEAMGVESVQTSDCGCENPRARLTVRPTSATEAELCWLQCSNCGGWPNLTPPGILRGWALARTS